MNQLQSKKIDSALKQLENAAKGAVRALNEVTNDEFADSSLGKEPLANIGVIASILQNAQEQAAKNARFDGMSYDEVAATIEEERETERQTLQKLAQEKLAKRQPQEPEPEPAPDAEPAGEENPPV